MKQLKISSGISLPIEAVTQTFAILAVKGSGKSYTASVMAEEMLKAGQQIVVLDITGAWYGLKSSADGKSEGFPVAIFGGDHSDVPLDENAGEVIAQAIVEQHFSAIIDLSLFRKNQAVRFLAPFLETLYRLNREPMHLFADEADYYVPQKVFGDQARTVGAMEDMVRRGRKKGIGCTLITQRPASINKDVLTQCEILIALRISHPRDIEPVMEWVKAKATVDQAEAMIKDLPELQTGIAYVWSPSWLRILKKISIRKRETFDSGITPKPGEKVIQPKKLAPIDIKKLGAAIQQTIEKKKADDPLLLKKKIQELQKLIDKKHSVPAAGRNAAADDFKTKFETSETARLHYYKVIQNLKETNEDYEKKFSKIASIIRHVKMPEIASILINSQLTEKLPRAVASSAEKNTPIKKHMDPPGQRSTNTTSQVSGGIKRILIALAQVYPESLTAKQIGVRAGLSSSSGTFGTYLGTLRSNGFVTGSRDSIQITEDGLQAVGDYQPLPTGSELFNYWKNELGNGGITRILEVLYSHYPESRTKQQLGEEANISSTSGTFGTYLGKLRTLQLIEGSNHLKASGALFD